MSCSKSLIKLRTLYSSRIYHPVTLLPIRCLCVAVPRPHSAGPSSNSTERQYATVQRSPKVKEAERARKHHPQAAPRESTQQQWPTPILYTAYMGGGFSIEPAKSVEILEAFSALMKYNRPTSEAVSRLCEEYEIEPGILSMLAQLLMKAGNPETFPLIREMLVSASALEDAAATIVLVTQAVETNRLAHADIAAPLVHLARLAQHGNPMGMVLHAEVLGTRGQTDQALRLCEEVVQQKTGSHTSSDASGDTTNRRAWTALAKLRETTGDLAGAESAFETAALEYDDPWGYYHLADRYCRPDDSEYLQFMLKAAASGIPDAAYKLGRYYLGLTPLPKKDLDHSGASDFGPKYGKAERKLLAVEWFSVSAESPSHTNIDDSRVYLALLLRAQGDLANGQAMLEKAVQSKIWGPKAVPWLSERWHSQQDFVDMEFLNRDLEKVIQGGFEGVRSA